MYNIKVHLHKRFGSCVFDERCDFNRKILSIQIGIASSCHFENTTVHWQNLLQKHQQKCIGSELVVFLS
jgi:hypothetical protein